MLYRYCLRRLLLMIPTLLGIVALAFMVLKLAPGDPLLKRLADVEPQAYEKAELRLRQRYQLDEPLPLQFLAFARRAATLDLRYIADDRPIWRDLARALPLTLLVNSLSVVFIYGLAVPVGVIGALKPRSRAVRSLYVALLVAYSLPSFWVAELLRLGFGNPQHLSWFPVMGLESEGASAWSFSARLVDHARHLVLPLVCLTYAGVAYVGQQLRAGLLDVLEQNFVLALRARGASERQLWLRHVLPNGLFPLLTLLGHSLPYLVAGSVVIETIFNLPGMGRLAVDAMMSREYDVVLGVLMISAALTLFGMLFVDVGYATLHPRVRFERAR